MNSDSMLPDDGDKPCPKQKHLGHVQGSQRNAPWSSWAFEYEHDGNKRQKKIRLSLWALVAFLAFILAFVLLFGPGALITLLKES